MYEESNISPLMAICFKCVYGEVHPFCDNGAGNPAFDQDEWQKENAGPTLEGDGVEAPRKIDQGEGLAY